MTPTQQSNALIRSTLDPSNSDPGKSGNLLLRAVDLWAGVSCYARSSETTATHSTLSLGVVILTIISTLQPRAGGKSSKREERRISGSSLPVAAVPRGSRSLAARIAAGLGGRLPPHNGTHNKSAGTTGWASRNIPKYKWGPKLMPERPTTPSCSPASIVTLPPTSNLGAISPKWLYTPTKPACCTSTSRPPGHLRWTLKSTPEVVARTGEPSGAGRSSP